MSTLIIVIALIVSVCLVVNYTLKHEHEIVEKADKSNFYHFLAKLTSSNYTGYYPNEGEIKAMKEFVKQPSEYDTHPIGSFFKMRSECDKMLKEAGSYSGTGQSATLPSGGDASIGFIVIVVFAVFVTLGVMYC